MSVSECGCVYMCMSVYVCGVSLCTCALACVHMWCEYVCVSECVCVCVHVHECMHMWCECVCGVCVCACTNYLWDKKTDIAISEVGT